MIRILSLQLATLVLFATQTLSAAPVITEFMASNKVTLQDEDGDYSDWIEIHNPDAAPVSLDGWYLTDTATNKTKWQFPAVTIPADGYLIVFASSKNRRDPSGSLHTNWGLSAGGEYLGLIAADGTTVVSEYAPSFPSQSDDQSYGITQPTDASETPQIGYFSTPTPGARNGGAESLAITSRVQFSRRSGLFAGTTTVSLSGAGTGEKIRYVLAEPSASGATVPAPTAASPEYTAPLTLDRSYVIRAAVFSTDGSRQGRPSSAQFIKIDDSTANRIDNFSSQLPLIVIDNHGFGPMVKDEIDHDGWFYTFTPGANGQTTLTSEPEHVTAFEFTVRGNSSAFFPKKSFKFDLIDEDGGDNVLPLLGLTAAEDWNIVGPYLYDRSYIRNVLAYDLFRRMGRWAPRTKLVELFLNWDGGLLDYNDYNGVYVLTDKLELDPNRVDVEEIDADDIDPDSITGGYFLRIDDADPEKLSWRTSRNLPEGDGSLFQVEEPKIPGLAPEQQAYIKGYIQDMEDALFADLDDHFATRRYLDYIDRPSWVDHHIIHVLLKNTDAFWRSTYFTKARGGKLVAGPVWDFDRSVDSEDPRDDDWDTWSLTKYTSQGFAMQYWESGWWGVLAQDPDFVQDWVDRWQTLRLDTFSDDQIETIVQGFADEIGTAAAARDAARWPNNVSRFGSFTEEIAHIRDWLTLRAHWIDDQFAAAPSVRDDGTKYRITPAPGIRFAYTLDGTDPRGPNGTIAPGARFVESEAAFPRLPGLRVRGYRDTTSDAPPQSPWSRLIIPASDPAVQPINPNESVGTRFEVQAGTDITFSVPSAGDSSVTYRWFFNGVEIVDATSRELNLTDLRGSHAGTYTLHIVSGGTTVEVPFILDIKGAAHLTAIAARAEVSSGENVLVAGFIVEGTGKKNFLARAVGPTLATQGINQPLAAPILRVFSVKGQEIASNTGWQNGPDAARIPELAAKVGAFALPAGSADSALVLELDPGLYTLHAAGAGDARGVALAELYALDEQSSPFALSSRAQVRSGENILIGGVVIGGTVPQRLLLRAVGPTLATQGIDHPLADPVLEVVRGQTTIHTNDDWENGNDAAALSTAFAAIGLPPFIPGSKDAALIVDLAPGVYTVLVKGKGADEGVALVEIYTAPESN
jgi:CotH protein.